MIDLFDIWLSAKQPFKDFEKEMEEDYDIDIRPKCKGYSNPIKIHFDIYTDSFQDFWDLYNKSRNKKGTYKKWQKLSYLEKSEIMLTLPEYIKATPDKKFRKDPSTYINQKSWKDEIIKENEYTTSDDELRNILES